MAVMCKHTISNKIYQLLCPAGLCSVGIFLYLLRIFLKYSFYLWHFIKNLVEGYERGNHHPPLRLRRERKCMIEPNRTEWQVRCAFNAFCKRVLKNEAINIYNEMQKRQTKEMIFSDLTPQEENQLYTLDKQYEGEEGESLQVAGKRITPKLLAEAMRTLPIEKRKTVLLYYFFDKSDVEIAELLEIPRSTVQYRRTSSFNGLKRFLEEHADDWDD